MPTQKGIAVIWGVGSTTNISNFGTYKLQSRDYSRKAEKAQIKDENGETKGIVFYEYTERATFRYIPNNTSGSAVVLVLPAIGDSFSIPDATATQISGAGWIVEDAGFKATNEGPLAADVEGWRYGGAAL